MIGAHLRSPVGIAALALAGALSVGAAKAQPYNYYGPGPNYVTNGQGVTVYAAPRRRGPSINALPTEPVRESRVVNFTDLNVATPWGAHALRWRIEQAALDACSDLDARYPNTDDAARDCYDGAVLGAMHRIVYQVGFTPADWY